VCLWLLRAVVSDCPCFVPMEKLQTLVQSQFPAQDPVEAENMSGVCASGIRNERQQGGRGGVGRG
jgi:hypothetical protein